MNIPVARSPEEVRMQILKGGVAYRSIAPNQSMSHGQKGLATGILNEQLGSDANRYLVLGWLFDTRKPPQPMRSRLLTDESWYGLLCWISPYKEDGKYKTRPEFPLEVALIYRRAVKEIGLEVQVVELPSLLTTVGNLDLFEENTELCSPRPLAVLDKLREMYRR
jgi:hypothetical protein